MNEGMKAVASRVGSVASRVVALDALRGLTVLGMIIVNTAAYLSAVDGMAAYPLLLHSKWAGYTIADAVFPAFILMVGVSVPLSLMKAKAGDAAARGKAFRAIGWRTVRLLIAGFIISNLYWLQTPDAEHIRVFGVLQRIGLVYGACAVLFLTTGARTRLMTAAAILVGYWAFCLLPSPDSATDLLKPGTNIVSWFERWLLGVHTWVKGPLGFDPEGPLSTLPAIAQGLIGAAVGEWLIARGPSAAAARALVVAGVAFTVAGVAWGLVYPPVKSIWTSSYVLLSTGPALIAFGGLYWMLDVRGWKPWGYGVAMAFGVNAITAYVLHEVGSIVLEAPMFHWSYDKAAQVLPPEAAALVPTAIFVALVWAPIGLLYRQRWIVKI